jgi:hypothetical protein
MQPTGAEKRRPWMIVCQRMQRFTSARRCKQIEVQPRQSAIRQPNTPRRIEICSRCESRAIYQHASRIVRPIGWLGFQLSERSVRDQAAGPARKEAHPGIAIGDRQDDQRAAGQLTAVPARHTIAAAAETQNRADQPEPEIHGRCGAAVKRPGGVARMPVAMAAPPLVRESRPMSAGNPVGELQRQDDAHDADGCQSQKQQLRQGDLLSPNHHRSPPAWCESTIGNCEQNETSGQSQMLGSRFEISATRLSRTTKPAGRKARRRARMVDLRPVQANAGPNDSPDE